MVEQKYIELLKKCVSHWPWLSSEQKAKRINGRDWPNRNCGETMIGLQRLDNIKYCLETILEENIEGDLIEAGVWRGGAVIFMKGILEAYQSDKTIWLADSFQGVPKPDVESFPEDKDDELYTFKKLAVTKQCVIGNFKKYDLFDDKIKFLEGWFKDTLPSAPIQKLALLRIDGDLYESTMQCLENLYPKLTLGGFCIIDDYGTFDNCKKAVHDFRAKFQIKEPIIDIDGWGIYWRKTF